MATELLSPLLPQRRRGLAVAVAVPLLALLLVVVIFFHAPLPTTVSSPERVDLTLVAGAREKGAGKKSLTVASFPF
jgi:O-palmitoleoyl-L-serine hydrolase